MYNYGILDYAGAITVFIIISSIALTVLSLIFITPESRKSSLPKGLQIVHDILNFNSLVLEKIFKVLYILSTFITIIFGAIMIFLSFITLFSDTYRMYHVPLNFFLSGILSLILGPIFVRIVYEFIMLNILLVKNVISINRKMGMKSQNSIDIMSNSNSNVNKENKPNSFNAVQNSPTTAPAKSFNPNKKGSIVCVRGEYAGATFEIGENGLTIGRDPRTCNLVLSQNTDVISRTHCKITYNPLDNSYTIYDYSTTGTFVNLNKRLVANQPSKFTSGTEFYLANQNNVFRLN